MSRNISLKEAFKMAAKTLVSNKLRSSLTMLGIIIGNASVINNIKDEDLITLQLNEGVIYKGQIEGSNDLEEKYKYV